MNVSVLSRKLFPKRVAIALFVLAVMSIGASEDSQAVDRFWRGNGFRSSGFRTTVQASKPNVAKARTPRPVSGYGANFHRNFTIRQQQQRSKAGGSLIYRGNVLWRR